MANTGAYPSKAGFSQAGGYFIILKDISNNLFSHRNTPVTTGIFGTGNLSDIVSTGKIIKDMGTTVIDNDVTYRKFQAVQTPSLTGQTGSAPLYLSFYLEVGRNGAQANSSGPAQIARYL